MVDEPADSEDDELVAPEELDACDDALCPNEPAIPWAAGGFGREPGPTDGTFVGEVAPGTDGVDTVGVWIAGACTGVVTCGGAGGVTVTGGAFGTVTGGTVTGGTVTGRDGDSRYRGNRRGRQGRARVGPGQQHDDRRNKNHGERHSRRAARPSPGPSREPLVDSDRTPSHYVR